MSWFLFIKIYFQYTVRVFRIGWGFLWNLRVLLRVPQPVVTVFGSARLDPNNEYAYHAYLLGNMLAQKGISVITGGGPGIMQAANLGAAHMELDQGKKITRSLGISTRGLEDEPHDPRIPEIKFRYFFMRKWFLTQFSQVIVVFPGGIGTLDEFFDVLNLEKHKMLQASHVILIGKEYWMPLITWLEDYGVKRDMIRPDILPMVKVTDSIEEVFELVHACCLKQTPVQK